MEIYTIGYEGAEIDAFLDTLRRVGVQHVIDIRDLPASRRRDFSKNILREHLSTSDIGYTHLKALGDPKEGREAMRRGDVMKFERVFAERMDTEEAQIALKEAIQRASELKSVLLCYERDPKSCHRTIVAKAMREENAFVIRHLGVQSRTRMSMTGAADREYQPSAY